MALLTNTQIEFAGLVASGIGFYPEVVAAQCLQEMSGVHARRRDQQRNYNWLNIGWYDAGRGSITYSRTWGDNRAAAQATIDFFLGRRFGPSAGIRAIVAKGRGKSPPAQITAICTSGWATDPNYCARIRSCYGMITRAGIRFPGGPGGGRAIDGTAESTGGSTETRVLPYEFSRGSSDKKENSWECMGRLADEVGWRRFMSGGTLWYVSEKWLERQPPMYRISAKSVGVVDLSFDFETRGRPGQLTLRAQARRYSMMPGDVVDVVDEGPAEGLWLISTVRRSLASQIAEVTLKRAQPKLPEPAPQTETVNVGGSDVALSGNTGAGAVTALAMVRLDNRWGGCQAPFEQFITPFLVQRGLGAPTGPNQQKRGTTLGGKSSAGSDHHTSQRNAFAADYGTSNGHSAAQALNDAMGGVGYRMNTYNSGSCMIGGARFRVQILWGGGIGHGDHVHCGLRRS